MTIPVNVEMSIAISKGPKGSPRRMCAPRAVKMGCVDAKTLEIKYEA